MYPHQHPPLIRSGLGLVKALSDRPSSQSLAYMRSWLRTAAMNRGQEPSECFQHDCSDCPYE